MIKHMKRLLKSRRIWVLGFGAFILSTCIPSEYEKTVLIRVRAVGTVLVSNVHAAFTSLVDEYDRSVVAQQKGAQPGNERKSEVDVQNLDDALLVHDAAVDSATDSMKTMGIPVSSTNGATNAQSSVIETKLSELETSIRELSSKLDSIRALIVERPQN